MLCFFSYEVLHNGDIITFLPSCNYSSARKFENFNNNFDLQFDLFPMQHYHFISDLVLQIICITMEELTSIFEVGDACLLRPTQLLSLHKPYYPMHTYDDINYF